MKIPVIIVRYNLGTDDCEDRLDIAATWDAAERLRKQIAFDDVIENPEIFGLTPDDEAARRALIPEHLRNKELFKLTAEEWSTFITPDIADDWCFGRDRPPCYWCDFEEVELDLTTHPRCFSTGDVLVVYGENVTLPQNPKKCLYRAF